MGCWTLGKETKIHFKFTFKGSCYFTMTSILDLTSPYFCSKITTVSDEFKRVTNTLSAKMRKYSNDVPNIIIGIRRVSPGTCESNIMS